MFFLEKMPYNLISFQMIETGKLDHEQPDMRESQVNPLKPMGSEPSFAKGFHESYSSKYQM